MRARARGTSATSFELIDSSKGLSAGRLVIVRRARGGVARLRLRNDCQQQGRLGASFVRCRRGDGVNGTGID